MKESTDFTQALINQKQLIIKLQEKLSQEIEEEGDSEVLEELSIAIESATEALTNLAQYCQDNQ